jgi:predicted nicotinamide N-methyase
MVAYLKDITSSESDATVPSHIAHLLSARNPTQLSVLELGCGCGMVGIALAQMRPRCDILLTDLPEAMGILELNISVAQPAEGSGLIKATLDWHDDLPSYIRDKVFDVILVSECTYNSDSLSALVKTLSSLVIASTEAQVILSTKVRHSSEAVFFEMMSAAGFNELEHSTIELPDPLRSQRGEVLELVDMYVFRHKSAGLPS